MKLILVLPFILIMAVLGWALGGQIDSYKKPSQANKLGGPNSVSRSTLNEYSNKYTNRDSSQYHSLSTRSHYVWGEEKVPILIYHYVRIVSSNDRIGFNLSITPQDFEAQMNYLSDNNFVPITINEFERALHGEIPIPNKAIILTFDDGYMDFYTTAFPILKKHQFKAVSYVVSGFIDRPGYLSGEMIKELSNNNIEIASHSVSHADLTTLTDHQLEIELMTSKTTLEALINKPVANFCYPSGRANARVIGAAGKAGYMSATSTKFGISQSLENHLWWPRIRISGGETLQEYSNAIVS